jgi:gluconolactonase
LVVCAVLAGCADDSGPGEEGAPDATVPADAASRDASRLDASVRDAAADSVRDAQLADGAPAPTPPDAQVDGTLVDAALPAVPDASLPRSTLRMRACGERSEWPAPLPALRIAARVGSSSFDFIEGPVWVDALGALLFSDMDINGGGAKGPPSQIRRLTPPASFDVFVAGSGSNGLALFGPDSVLAATHDTRSLSFFDVESKRRTDVDIGFDGNAFNSPNDLAVREDGWVYFTDPDYQRGSRAAELDETGVYRIKLGNPPALMANALQIDGTLRQPNGVALSPDQQTLYVGSSGDEIWKFQVAPDGSVSNREEFARVGGSDGLTVDCAGNLYVTSDTVEVFAANGDKLGDIEVAESPSNVAFGGSDHQTLYITARTHLYSIRLNVAGFPF